MTNLPSQDSRKMAANENKGVDNEESNNNSRNRLNGKNVWRFPRDSRRARPHVSVLSCRCRGPAAGTGWPPCTTAAVAHTVVGARGASDPHGRLREHSVLQTNPATKPTRRSPGSAASWRGARPKFKRDSLFPDFVPLTVNVTSSRTRGVARCCSSP